MRNRKRVMVPKLPETAIPNGIVLSIQLMYQSDVKLDIYYNKGEEKSTWKEVRTPEDYVHRILSPTP